MISSLARLETIQEQLDSLRQTMPLLVRSLTRPHRTPEDLFKDFRNVTVQTQKKLISVKATWESKETKGIFERVKARGLENVVVDVEDIKKVPVYGWIEEVEGRRNKRKFEGEDDQFGEERVRKLVEDYKARHEGIEAECEDDTIKVCNSLQGSGSRMGRDIHLNTGIRKTACTAREGSRKQNYRVNFWLHDHPLTADRSPTKQPATSLSHSQSPKSSKELIRAMKSRVQPVPRMQAQLTNSSIP